MFVWAASTRPEQIISQLLQSQEPVSAIALLLFKRHAVLTAKVNEELLPKVLLVLLYQ